ncbi:hypothetical protein C0J52_08249 [Blattella germanica]|nr:hypothetical protein C0J52_08249 [Blattella germanica]
MSDGSDDEFNDFIFETTNLTQEEEIILDPAVTLTQRQKRIELTEKIAKLEDIAWQQTCDNIESLENNSPEPSEEIIKYSHPGHISFNKNESCCVFTKETLKFLRLFAGEVVHEESATTHQTTTETENVDMIVEDVILGDEGEFSREVMDECVPVPVAVPSSTTVSAKKKSKSTGNRGLSGIEDLAAQSSSLCEIEKELLIKKYKKKDQLLDIKIQNALLEQQILKKKLEEVTRID